MIKAPSDPVAGENLLPGLQNVVFSLGPHMVERARETPRVFLIKALIPFSRAPSS